MHHDVVYIFNDSILILLYPAFKYNGKRKAARALSSLKKEKKHFTTLNHSKSVLYIDTLKQLCTTTPNTPNKDRKSVV